MVLNFWTFLLLFGLCQGLFLMAVLLFHRRGNRQSNRLLAALIGVITVQLFSYLLVSTDLYVHLPHLLNVGLPLMFLIGPLYYLYIRSLMEGGFRLEARHLLHAAPVLLATIYLMPYFLDPAEEKIAMLEYIKAMPVVEIPFAMLLYMGLHTLQTGVYIVLAIRLLRDHQVRVEDVLKNGRRLKSAWLKQFSAVFLAYWVFTFLGTLLLEFMDSYAPQIDYGVFFSMSIIIHVVGFAAVRESGIFSDSMAGSTVRKYQSSPVGDEEARELVGRLKEVMERERPYLDNDLSLSDLADALEISPNYLSQILNQEMKSSFYDFVNGYRVREAKLRLRSPEMKHLTILAVAYEVGFNNKNSFNKAFKKDTGLTPSAFMRRNGEPTA